MKLVFASGLILTHEELFWLYQNNVIRVPSAAKIFSPFASLRLSVRHSGLRSNRPELVEGLLHV
jgi:hypothetical protein